MKRVLILLLIVFPQLLNAASIRSAILWDVDDVRLSRYGSDSIMVYIDFNVINDDIAKNCAVVFQPNVCVGGNRFDIRPISFYRLDSRGNKPRIRKESLFASGSADEVSRCSGMSRGKFKYSCVAPGFSDKDSVEIFVDVVEYRAVEKKNAVECRKVSTFIPTPCPEFYPDFFSVYVPEDKYNNHHSVCIPLRVTFAPKKTVFDMRYEDNEGDMYSFCEKVRTILQSGQTKVSSVSLKSYCSIEGSSSENLKNCTARFNSVFSYLKKQKVFGKRNVRFSVVGEDWDGLYSWFKGTFWVNEKSVRDVIYNYDISVDVKEKKLKEVKPFWDNLAEYVFPQMERTDCLIDYTLLPYKSDEERWIAYNSDKSMLSQYDYCCLMKSLNMWSSSWYDAVFDFASEYPLCQEAQINAFAASLSLGHVNEAGKYLRYLSSDENTKYYKAVWLMYMGDIEGSYELSQSLDKHNLQYENTISQIERIYNWCHSMSPWRKTVYPRFNRG